MKFNDTTTYDGLVQGFERWTRQPRGTVSGSDDLLKEFASMVNSGAYPKIMPRLLAYNDQIRWDDLNHTDAPIGYVDLVQNQNDYKITEDDNSLDILNITHVRTFGSATATVYTELERVTADDPRVPGMLSTTQTGVPTAFVELGNVIYFDCLPNYAATNGIEIFFGRQHSYFAYSDTTKEPGIPLPFHQLLYLIPALEWNSINRTDDTNLLTLLREEIAKIENDLDSFISLRNPTKVRMSMKPINYR